MTSDRTDSEGAQGPRLYEYLDSLPSDKGVTVDEMAEMLDTTPARVGQLLTRIRRGMLKLPGKRGGKGNNVYPKLAIHFDRLTERYYNLSKANLSNSASHTPGEILRTWLQDCTARTESVVNTYGEQVEVGKAHEDVAVAVDLLNQLTAPSVTDGIDSMVDLVATLDRHRRSAINARGHRRRQLREAQAS